MIEETNNQSVLSEKYVYYRTIPVLNDWITLKKYIPETYYNFFEEDGHHYDYDEFVSKYNEDENFKEFITAFQKINRRLFRKKCKYSLFSEISIQIWFRKIYSRSILERYLFSFLL